MQLKLLYELQDLHKELGLIEKKLEELHKPKNLGRLKEEYQRLRDEYVKREENLKANSYQQEIKNNEIKNLDSDKKSNEKIKYSRETDTVKKLETIEKQLEMLEEKKQRIENDVIMLLGEADNISKGLIEGRKRLNFIKKKYTAEKEGLDTAVKELEAQKTELSARIAEMERMVERDSFELYKKVQKAHADPVAIVESRMCSGCKMEIPSMDYEALKTGSQEMRCQSCGRLLFFYKP